MSFANEVVAGHSGEICSIRMPESNRRTPATYRVPRGLVEAELRSISHVTHLQNALAILREGQIKARLVYDDSVLNSTRTHVVWLSPNDWSGSGGSRYGNVEFQFDWAYIAQAGSAWWIGSMGYSPPAARILITDQIPDASLSLVPYDPSAPGPWERGPLGRNLWNYNICLEVLVERDLSLDGVTKLECVRHHDARCNILPGSTCPDAGLTEIQAAPLLVAAVVAGDVPHRNLFSQLDGTPSDLVEQAWTTLFNLPRRAGPGPSGTVAHTAPEAEPLARAILAAVAARRDDDVGRLCGMFQDRANLREALAAVIEAHLGFERGTLER